MATGSTGAAVDGTPDFGRPLTHGLPSDAGDAAPIGAIAGPFEVVFCSERPFTHGLPADSGGGLATGSTGAAVDGAPDFGRPLTHGLPSDAGDAAPIGAIAGFSGAGWKSSACQFVSATG